MNVSPPPSALKDIWGAFPHPSPGAEGRKHGHIRHQASLHINPDTELLQSSFAALRSASSAVWTYLTITCSKHCCVSMWHIWTSKQLNEEQHDQNTERVGAGPLTRPDPTRRQTQGCERRGLAAGTVKRRTHLLPLFPSSQIKTTDYRPVTRITETLLIFHTFDTFLEKVNVLIS